MNIYMQLREEDLSGSAANIKGQTVLRKIYWGLECLAAVILCGLMIWAWRR